MGGLARGQERQQGAGMQPQAASNPYALGTAPAFNPYAVTVGGQGAAGVTVEYTQGYAGGYGNATPPNPYSPEAAGEYGYGPPPQAQASPQNWTGYGQPKPQPPPRGGGRY